MHPSLHSNCHAKFNFKIGYPTPYEREVRHYKEADTDLIRRSLEMVDWDRAFTNNVKGIVNICTNTTTILEWPIN